jgi:mRNA interferase MazF
MPKDWQPEAGDLIWTYVESKAGREQSGRGAALVVSPSAFFRASGFVIVCPITSDVRGRGTSVVLPAGLSVSGEILTSHVRSIDTGLRGIAFTGSRVSADVLADVRAKLAALIGL